MEPDAQNAAAPGPQIRTYASDVAKLTGKPMPAAVKNEIASPRAPLPPPPAAVIPKAPTTDEKRDEVLARLKTRAAPAAPAPVPTAPRATTIPKAPSTGEKREEVLARLAAQARRSPVPAGEARVKAPSPEAPPGIPTLIKDVPAPSPIHTYTTDFSEKTKAEGASPISVLAAEADARQPAPVVVRPRRSSAGWYAAAAVALIIAGGASIFFAYRIISGKPPLPQEIAIASLIFADERVELAGTSDELARGLVKMEDLALPDGGVAIAYMTYATTTANKKEVRIAAEGGALIGALGLSAPSILLRNVAPASTLGVVSAGGETRPFFILRVTSFERTFAGMLDWEATMRDDLSLFFPPYPSAPAIPPSATTTATSTPRGASSTPAVPAAQAPRGFMDVIIDNRDARIMKDSQGRTVLIYGYRDKETLIIARNEAAFRELLSRLSSTSAR